MANLVIKWKDLLAEHCNRKRLPKPDYVVAQRNGRQEISLSIPAENFSETIDAKFNLVVAENTLALKAIQSLTDLNIDGPSARQQLNQYSQKFPFKFEPTYTNTTNGSYVAHLTFEGVKISSSPLSKKKDAEQDLAKKIIHQIAKSTQVDSSPPPSETPLSNSQQVVVTCRSRLNEYCQKNNLSPLSVTFEDAYLPEFGGSAMFNKILFESNSWKTKAEVEEELSQLICEHLGISKEQTEQQEEEEPVERVVDVMSPGKEEIPVQTETESFISRVNEYSQKNKLSAPSYHFESEGPHHSPTIYAIVKWHTKTIKSRGCKTKSEAKNAAAKKLWDEVIYPELIPSPKEPSSPRVAERPSPVPSPVQSPKVVVSSPMNLRQRRENIIEIYELLQINSTIDFSQVLEYLNDEDPIIKRMASYCTEIIMHRDKSAKYWYKHYVDTSDCLSNGFYDVGRSVNPFPSLTELLKQPKNARECILFDTSKDAQIKKFLEDVRNEVVTIKDIKDKVLRISQRVWERMGKSVGNLLELSDKNIWQLQEEAKSRVVLLGSIQYGVCRHRALLFKIAADCCGIKSRLVRGKMSNENHAWNVVKINEEYYLVDVTNDHNQLLKEGEHATEIYKRTDGNIGGRSVDGSEIFKYEDLDIDEKIELGKSNHIVYEAFTKKDRKPCAVKKILLNGPVHKNREVAIYRQLKHPNITKFMSSYEKVDKGKNYLCIVMEKLGPSLEKYVTSSEIELLLYSLDIAKALHYLHREFNEIPVIHRDVKPANILVDESKKIAKLCDFGVAKNGVPETLVFTECYMAPELIPKTPYHAKRNHKIDVYSYGETVKQLIKKWGIKIQELEGLIEDMTNADPDKRPEFAEICEQLISLLKNKYAQ